MKFYVLADIEGVAGLSCWEEARSANSEYGPMAREMSLEAAAVARGLWAAGAKEVVVEDGHGDGRNIDCAFLPKKTLLLRGITHEILGLTGIFDESFDGLILVGFHDAASRSGNPTSHTMVSSRVFQLRVNGEVWGEADVSVHAAAYRGVPTVLVSGDQAVCESVQGRCPGIPAVATKSGGGYSVLTRTPEQVQGELEEAAVRAAERLSEFKPIALPEHFHVEVTYIHHYDAYGCKHYPGARLLSPTTLAFDADDYGEVLRFFYFVI